MSTPCENCGSHIRVCVDCDFYKGKYIEIPDNATNGDVIMAMFPKAEVILNKKNTISWMYKGMIKTYPLDWWNAPYQKGGKE